MFKFNINTQSTHTEAQKVIAALIGILPEKVIGNLNGALAEAPYGALVEVHEKIDTISVELTLFSQRNTLSRYVFKLSYLGKNISEYMSLFKQLNIDEEISSHYKEPHDWIYTALPKRNKYRTAVT